jgi:hypothetical protein
MNLLFFYWILFGIIFAFILWREKTSYQAGLSFFNPNQYNGRGANPTQQGCW